LEAQFACLFFAPYTAGTILRKSQYVPADGEEGKSSPQSSLTNSLPDTQIQTSTYIAPRRARTAGVVSIITVLVAIAGSLREATLAGRFGISVTMDAYFAAIFIPNILYLVLIAGTLSPVFIPILLQQNPKDDPDSASLTFSAITNFALLVFVVIVSVGTLAARLWLPWLFPGFSPSTMEVAVHLVYIVFPALPFLAAAGIFTALLNGFHKFWLPAFAPAVSSICVIAAAFFFYGSRAIYAVAFATALGFVLQCMLLLPGVASVSIRYRPVFDFRHPAIRKLLRLGVPLFLYLAVSNFSGVLERNFASRISAGALSTLTYALRLFTMPANFLAAPLAIVAYPAFALEAARERRGELAGQVSHLFRLVVFVFLPATVWMVLNAPAVTRILYEHGKFSFADSQITSHILGIYSLGIVPNAIAIVLLRCFFAIEDTISPLLAEVVNLGAFVILASVLSTRFGITGLVSAKCMTFFLVMGILIVILRRHRLLKLQGIGPFLLGTAVATAALGVMNWSVWRVAQPMFDSSNTAIKLAITFIGLVLSAGIYLGVALLLRLGEARQIIHTMLDLVPGRSARAGK
jgi:putative peptidoglycan lipid II flippase